jgi:hypothetical protein
LKQELRSAEQEAVDIAERAAKIQVEQVKKLSKVIHLR